MTKTVKHYLKADALLEKGIELLWSKGYTATSVNDIVKVAGVPKGSFYFYFESKEDFVIKAIHKYFEEHFEPSRDILLDKSISPKQRLLNFHQYRCDQVKNEMNCKLGCMACNLANELSEHNEQIRLIILEKGDAIRFLIAGVIQEAQDCGEIDGTMKAIDLASFIEDAAKGALTTMKEMQSSYPIDNFKNIVEHVFLR
ncbi:MAG: hypothetical protein BM557_06200 [Flavobacterium sp. MedPE-SWcel]|uniref:TetR/AcrR family transcriptional regulator n=1 Tax=uncultured Flavobacterium sp. TaxID=165435 RepID=UPI000910CE31|nr:TetR/AcrR family transcriptional regulator [uncultured Flavobacterium sp.]OIQ19293.1 MAG: hypothetical protein BM557_06200 [Flavobacterium sp. MedPE-SWcel]